MYAMLARAGGTMRLRVRVHTWTDCVRVGHMYAMRARAGGTMRVRVRVHTLTHCVHVPAAHMYECVRVQRLTSPLWHLQYCVKITVIDRYNKI